MFTQLLKFANISDTSGNYDLADELTRLIEAKSKNKKDVSIGAKQAAALFAFGAWLTTRKEESGPFGSKNECGDMANLIVEFCDSQNWHLEEDWTKGLKPYPKEKNKKYAELAEDIQESRNDFYKTNHLLIQMKKDEKAGWVLNNNGQPNYFGKLLMQIYDETKSVEQTVKELQQNYGIKIGPTGVRGKLRELGIELNSPQYYNEPLKNQFDAIIGERLVKHYKSYMKEVGQLSAITGISQIKMKERIKTLFIQINNILSKYFNSIDTELDQEKINKIIDAAVENNIYRLQQ
jgi:hypothetical protein